MIVKEVEVKSILSKSKVFDYTLNPYVGCEHACTYCYARVMKRFTGHKEPWGKFVDVKVNAAELLKKEIQKKKRGRVWISGMCDPYQPLEREYEITRKCLQIFCENGWSVTIQTKSPLVLRDLDILKNFENVEVGFTITTASEKIRKIFEPYAPSIQARINALEKLKKANIPTYAMIGPILPKAEKLVERLRGKVDYVLVDRMNYHYADHVYKKHKLEHAMSDNFFYKKKEEFTKAFKKEGIKCEILF
jgi:DNA repair photolyase